MIRVAYITDAVGLGGGETSLLNYLEACAASGVIEPILVCPEGDLWTAARRHGIRVIALNVHSISGGMRGIVSEYIPSMLSIFKVLRQLNVHIVHAESLIALCHLLPVLSFSSMPVFLTWHGFGNINSFLMRKLINKRLKKAFAVSQSATEGILRLLPKHRVVCLPLSIDPRLLSPPLKSRAALLAEMDLPSNRPVILQLARFQEIKGQLTLLTAYEQARNTGRLRDAVLVYVGGVLKGSDGAAADYYEKVACAAKASTFASDIFIRPFVSDVKGVLSMASVLAIPSRYESFGMVAIEAMAVGVPVVATNTGGLVDIVTHQHDGLLVDVHDAEAFARQLDNVVADPALARRLVGNGRATVRSRYLPETRVARVLAYYEDAL